MRLEPGAFPFLTGSLLSECPGIFSFVRACSVTSNSFVTPWTVTRQTPLSMEFSRQKHWSALLFPSPGNLPCLVDQNCVSRLLHWQVDSLLLHPLGSPYLALCVCVLSHSVVSNSFVNLWLCLPGSSVHGILQARILEQVAIPFSRGSSQPKD